MRVRACVHVMCLCSCFRGVKVGKGLKVKGLGLRRPQG